MRAQGDGRRSRRRCGAAPAAASRMTYRIDTNGEGCCRWWCQNCTLLHGLEERCSGWPSWQASLAYCSASASRTAVTTPKDTIIYRFAGRVTRLIRVQSCLLVLGSFRSTIIPPSTTNGSTYLAFAWHLVVCAVIKRRRHAMSVSRPRRPRRASGAGAPSRAPQNADGVPSTLRVRPAAAVVRFPKAATGRRPRRLGDVTRRRARPCH